MISKNKKIIFILVVVAIAAFFLLLISSPDNNIQKNNNIQEDNVYSSADEARWAKLLAEDTPEIVASGWGKPVYLEINKLGWIESGHISDDGNTFWYMFYQGKDLFNAAVRGGPFEGSADIYVSNREPDGQFRKHKPVNKYFMVEKYGACCPAPYGDGSFLYNSEREGRSDGWTPGDYKNHIFLDDRRLPFNKKDEAFANPFYCKAKDELWFDSKPDTEIGVLRNAAKNDFAGEIEIAPSPINSPNEKAQDAQPWLSEDCNTMYFISNRERVGQYYDGHWIYTSKRLDEKGYKWSEPELFMKSKVALGEPTMTADGKKLFFSQYLIDTNNVDSKTGIGELRAIAQYVERT